MRLSAVDLEDLTGVAVAAAAEAGRMIADSRPTEIEHKVGGGSLASQVVTEIDRQSEALIVERLGPAIERYDLGLLTEETEDDGGRLRADHFWCVDPLDGTLPFIEGRPGSAVSIALIARDGTPVIGAAYDVTGARVVHAVAGGGAFIDGRPWEPVRSRSGEALTVFADRRFVEQDPDGLVAAGLDRIAQDLGLSDVDLRVGAGAVMNALGALTNPPGCYVKVPAAAGGGSLWDFAATACIFGEVGAVATDIHGAPLDLNRPDSTFMHHRGVLFATDEDLAERLRELPRKRF